MANKSYLNLDDELDDQEPYSSLKSSGSVEDLGLDQSDPVMPPSIRDSVRSTVSKKLGGSTDSYLDDPLMKNFDSDQAGLNSLREAKRGADSIGNMGQAFAQMAQGANAPKLNQNLYDNMSKQNESMMKTGEDALDRKQKVIQAIEQRKSREGIAANANEDKKLRRQEIAAYKSALLQGKTDKEATKREEKELALAVPGYERTGEVLPKPEDVSKFRSATASAEQLGNKLGRLRELVKKVGSFEYGGEDGQEMESLATEIQLLSKNEDMYKLGVLTGPDMSLLTKITADPTSLSSLFTRNPTRLKQIDSQISSIKDKLASSAKSMGYREPSGMTHTDEQSGAGKIVAKRQYSASRNQTKLVYSDGSEVILDGKQ